MEKANSTSKIFFDASEIEGQQLLWGDMSEKFENSSKLEDLNPEVGFVFNEDYLVRSTEKRLFRAVVIVASWCSSSNKAVRLANICFDRFVPFTIVTGDIFIMTSITRFEELKKHIRRAKTHLLVVPEDLDCSFRDLHRRMELENPAKIHVFRRYVKDPSVSDLIEAASQDEFHWSFATIPFYLFMRDYMRLHKRNKLLGNAGLQKWTSMSKEEQAPYNFKAEQRRTKYLPMGNTKGSTAKKANNKLAVKRNAGGSERAAKKPTKDPNKPETPASAFFVFMEDFSKSYKEKFPNNKSVSVVGKAGGDKWKSMSDAEKAPYVAKARKRKTESTKTMQAYNKMLAEGNDAEEEEELDKSEPEINDEDDEEESDEVGKAGGDKWKSMSDAEKTPYVAKAEKRKMEYTKTVQAYNKKLAEGNDAEEEEEWGKSKSEINDEDDEEESDEVGKAGGDKWKSMPDAEKTPYVAKAEKRKMEYTKTMQAYNKKLAEGNDAEEEEEWGKSKSEINDEDDEEESDEEEDDE